MTPIIQLPKWTLDEALILIRAHQIRFHEMNYHLALAGSVLNYGESHNDLDIICMSMNNEHDPYRKEMLSYLDSLGKVYPNSDEEYELEIGWELLKIITENGKKIDFFLFDRSTKQDDPETPTSPIN